jgi:2-isopropylmalate synthase
MMSGVLIFDTTLRDGEQSPGCSMAPSEKVRMAHGLAELGVDVLEAGFAASTPEEVEAIGLIGQEVRGPVIAALARAHVHDIQEAARALEKSERPRIHVFIATSDLHLERKLRIGREECVERTGRSVELARSLVDDVEFSAEDATRTPLDFLVRVVETAVSAGAETVNLPDTVGYALPHEVAHMVRTVLHHVRALATRTISVHCHDDLGLAVANSLAGVEAGARQVECTINGIGERAGNASLEEIVMMLRVRQDALGLSTGIRHEHLYRASQLLASITGVSPQPNKAIVGKNAFAHEAGIHQHGMLADRRTYEIMTPEMVGAPASSLVLGKHSGKHGLEARFKALGYALGPDDLDRVTRHFKRLADRKKEILDEDLLAILPDSLVRSGQTGPSSLGTPV